jgi:hypothetical protein
MKVGIHSRCHLELVGMPAGGGTAGDPESLDLSEASERLSSLFNREGAFISHCVLAQSVKLHRDVSVVGRHNVQ